MKICKRTIIFLLVCTTLMVIPAAGAVREKGITAASAQTALYEELGYKENRPEELPKLPVLSSMDTKSLFTAAVQKQPSAQNSVFVSALTEEKSAAADGKEETAVSNAETQTGEDSQADEAEVSKTNLVLHVLLILAIMAVLLAFFILVGKRREAHGGLSE